MPRVSVIMPLFENAKYLPEAIESILGQSYKDFELLIVSEPTSSDGSLQIADAYAAKDKRVIHMVNEKRLGHCASRNRGIRAARGEFWAIMDADDISGPRRLEVQLLYMDTYPEIGAFGIRHSVINNPSWIVDYYCDPEVVKAMAAFHVPLRHPTIMVRREWAMQHNLYYDESLPGAEDVDFQQRMSLCFPMSVINDPTLFGYRRHDANLGRSNRARDLVIWKQAMGRHLKKTLNLDLEDSDLDLLLIHVGILQYQARKQTERYTRLEKVMRLILHSNEKIKFFDCSAMKYVLENMWAKQMLFLIQNRGSMSKVPRALKSIYMNSIFYRPVFLGL